MHGICPLHNALIKKKSEYRVDSRTTPCIRKTG